MYTILTDKAAKGRKGAIVAIVAGVKAEAVIEILRKIPAKMRRKVKEITLDMAGNMELIAKRSFPLAVRVTDRSMYSNWQQKPYRKCELNIGGQRWTQKMKL